MLNDMTAVVGFILTYAIKAPVRINSSTSQEVIADRLMRCKIFLHLTGFLLHILGSCL